MKTNYTISPTEDGYLLQYIDSSTPQPQQRVRHFDSLERAFEEIKKNETKADAKVN